MKAAVFYGKSDIRIEEVPVPEVSDDEVLVKTLRIGICPTDLKYYLGLRGESTYDNPKFTTGKDTFGLSGHEIVGEIVEVGRKVKSFNEGDLVTHETFTYCGECKYCRRGLVNLCEKKIDIARGYAEYVRAPQKFVHKFKKGTDVKFAAFAEPLSVVIHAVRKIPLENIAIVGAGPMGVLMAMYSDYKGKNVLLLETREDRRKFAREIGVKNVMDPINDAGLINSKISSEIFGVVSSVGGKNPIDYALSLSSSSAPVVIFGGTYPAEMLTYDPNRIHYTEKIITGSTDHTVDDMDESIMLIEERKLHLDRIVTGEYSLSQLKEAFDNTISGKEMKVQIKFK
jgi:L-iditol 2-dehydrogenase